jgi:hypothetical protein
MVAVAKALGDAAKDTKVLALRGGVMQGRDDLRRAGRGARQAAAGRVLRAQLLGAVVAPLTAVSGCSPLPLRDLVGLIDGPASHSSRSRATRPASGAVRARGSGAKRGRGPRDGRRADGELAAGDEAVAAAETTTTTTPCRGDATAADRH